MESLGRLVDVVAGAVPVDLSVAGITGKRVSLRNAGGVTIVFVKGVGTGGENPTLTLRQHTAGSAGVSANLAIIDHYYLKDAVTITGAETWTKVTQTVAATITDPGAATTSATHQQIVVIEVDAAQLSDGYTHVSLDVADVGVGAQLGCVLILPRDLHVQRAPANLVNPQS